MYTCLGRNACLTLLATGALLITGDALAQTVRTQTGPPATPGTVYVQPVAPTFQQLAYADQTARTGSFVTPPGEAYLGAAVDPRYSNAAVVASVVPGSPAALAGIRPGDAIVALGNHRIDSPNDFNVIMRAMSPGAVIDVGVRRGRTTSARVVLGYAPRGSEIVLQPTVEQALIDAYRRR